jgi:hypothetical protein
MLPFLLAAVGGYLIGEGTKDKQILEEGGMMEKGGEVWTMGEYQTIEDWKSIVKPDGTKKTESAEGYPIRKNGVNVYLVKSKKEAIEMVKRKNSKMADGGMMAEGGEVKVIQTKFNSHKNHNHNADILEGKIDKDSFITYYVYVNGKDIGKEGMEYYTGENYVVGSNKKSSSRNYSVDKIPSKYKKAWDKLKLEYEEKHKEKMAEGGKMAKGGMQGYDDKEDERLAMEHGKIAKKDFVGTHKQKEHSRRDDAKFEKRK